MSYKITIEETKTTDILKKGEWVVIGGKEVPRETDYYNRDDKEPKTRIDKVYGYAPDRVEPVTTRTQIYEQVVGTLDLAAVIKAVNGLA